MAGGICARSLAVPLAASVAGAVGAGAVGAGAGAVGVGAGALVAVAVGVAFVDAAGLAGGVALAAAAGLAGVADGLGVAAAGARNASGKPEPAEVDAGLEGLTVAFAGVVALAGGVAAALPDGVAEAPPDGVALGVAVGAGAGAAFGASTRTGRKRSCEDLLRESTVLCGGLPGSEMTMLRPPWVATSASATPLPSTRWRMMSTALSIWPWLMVRLPTTLGSRISCVPPSRSRPSLGVSCASPQVCTEARRP